MGNTLPIISVVPLKNHVQFNLTFHCPEKEGAMGEKKIVHEMKLGEGICIIIGPKKWGGL